MTPSRRLPPSRLLAGAALCAALAACSAADSSAEQPLVGSPAASPTPSPVGPAPTLQAPRELAVAAAPLRLRVPALGIDAPVGPVGKAADGTVQVPTRWEDVGWYSGGARPGQPGPTVLLGHVDSRNGPAVFVRLPQARPGTVVEVTTTDGERHRYQVRRVEQDPKTRFPTEAVYLPVLTPELRLVTCGGDFDRSTGHYRDNIIVYAAPAA